MRVYTSDAAGTKYWWGHWNGTTLDPTQGLLYPYTHGSGIQSDPTFQNNLRKAVGFTGYGYNYAYLSPSDYPAPTYDEVPIPVTESQLAHASSTVTFGSCARINNWAYANPTLEPSTYLEPPSSQYPSFHARANGVGTTVWADGHAKSFHPIYRNGSFGYGYDSRDFNANSLGELAPSSAFSDDYFALD